MERSIDETMVNQSFQSPPRRRRSTFFEHRDSMVPQILSENTNKIDTKENAEEKQYCQNIERYYHQLLIEKEQWKKEVNNRRNVYHDLRQQFQMATKAPSRSRISYSALTTEDIEFLKAKPNISKLVDCHQKLHKSVKETKALYRRANELDDVILNYAEDKVVKITEYILENSTVEPVE